MRKKLQHFHRKIRENDINTYKENVRDNLIEAFIRDGKIQDLNKQLQPCIEAQDAERYFEKFMSTQRHILKGIDKSIIFNSYRLFARKLENFKYTQLLRDLIEIHTSSLIAQESLSSEHNLMFCQIHRLSNEMIGKLNESDDNVRQMQLENYLAMLSCFYAPKYHNYLKNLIEQKGEQFIIKYIIPWANNIDKNIGYLKLLTNALSNSQLTRYWNQRIIDEALILRLSCNLQNQDDKVMYLSLIALNCALKHVQTLSEKSLQEIMPRYLQVIYIMCPQMMGSCNFRCVDFKKDHLLESICVLEKLIRIVWEMKYKRVGMGRLMNKYSTFQLFSLINQMEYFPNRCLLYGLLEFTICIAMELQEDDDAMCLIGNELKGTLVLGLGNKFSNHITLNALHSIQRLVRYESCAYSRKTVVQGFNHAGVQSILEYLQFNKNHEVAAISLSLLDGQFSQQAFEAFK